MPRRSEQKMKEEEEVLCKICNAAVLEDDLLTFPECRHIFHSGCIAQFRCCPVCPQPNETSNGNNSVVCFKCSKNIKGTKVFLNCGHSFHNSCISRKLRLKKRCPDCKKKRTFQENSSEKNVAGTCSMCHEVILSCLDKFTHRCGHTYHEACLNELLRLGDTCPSCPQQITYEESTLNNQHTPPNSDHGINDVNNPTQLMANPLPSTSEHEINDDTNSGQCSICSGANIDEMCKLTFCGHAFHSKCIRCWLDLRNTCPDCQSQPNTVEERNNSISNVPQRVNPTRCPICSMLILSGSVSGRNVLHCGYVMDGYCAYVWFHIWKKSTCPACLEPCTVEQAFPWNQTRTSNTESTSTSEPEECTICWDESSSDWVSLQCGHTFHLDCLAPWMRQRNSCPICRQECVILEEGPPLIRLIKRVVKYISPSTALSLRWNLLITPLSTYFRYNMLELLFCIHFIFVSIILIAKHLLSEFLFISSSILFNIYPHPIFLNIRSFSMFFITKDCVVSSLPSCLTIVHPRYSLWHECVCNDQDETNGRLLYCILFISVTMLKIVYYFIRFIDNISDLLLILLKEVIDDITWVVIIIIRVVIIIIRVVIFIIGVAIFCIVTLSLMIYLHKQLIETH